MDRLTEFWSGSWILSFKARGAGYDNYSVLERLATYEDTGLEPDEIPHWIPADKKLPELPNQSYASVGCWAVTKERPNEVTFLVYCREVVRGKTVERWKWHDRIFDETVIYWMEKPQPPKATP